MRRVVTVSTFLASSNFSIAVRARPSWSTVGEQALSYSQTERKSSPRISCPPMMTV